MATTGEGIVALEQTPQVLPLNAGETWESAHQLFAEPRAIRFLRFRDCQGTPLNLIRFALLPGPRDGRADAEAELGEVAKVR
jgi:hypothetical protein